MKLFVDDIRDAPEGWVLARSISEAINFIDMYRGSITHLSLDHDISIQVEVKGGYYNRPSPDTFQVVAKYAVELVAWEETLAKDWVITTHSSNPTGRKAIIKIFDDNFIKCTETPYETAHRTPPARP